MFAPLLSPLQSTAYALMRFVTGLTFAFHGTQKVFGVLADSQPDVGTQIWFGGMIELIAGFAIAVGFLTRPMAFLASGTMAVAYSQFHWKFAVDDRFFPTVNGGELALVYCLLFFYVACAGSGRFSLEAQAKLKRQNKL